MKASTPSKKMHPKVQKCITQKCGS